MKAIERFYQYIDYKGIKPTRFEKENGLSNGYLGTQYKRKGNLGEDVLNTIIDNCLDINPNWLLTGKGKMLLKEDLNILSEPEIEYGSKIFSLPKLPIEAVAGVFTGDVQVMEYECERYVVPMLQGADFLIPVLGDSMYPTYNNGDVIACKKLESWSWFQSGKIYVIYTSQGVILKRVREGSKEDRILVISDNLAYPPFELLKEEIIGVALVIGGLWLE